MVSLSKKYFIESTLPVETNIVIFKIKNEFLVENFLSNLQQHHIKAVSMGKNKVRFVMHLDITQSDFETLLHVIESMEMKMV